MMLTGEMLRAINLETRLFEMGGWFTMSPPKMRRQHDTIAVYGKPDGRRLWTRNKQDELHAWTFEEGRDALEVPWMTSELEVREAIPPAYARFIGRTISSSGGSVDV